MAGIKAWVSWISSYGKNGVFVMAHSMSTSGTVRIDKLIKWWDKCLNKFGDSMEKLVGLAFSGSVGMTLLVLGCALPQYNNWWPFFVIIFYILSPLPTVISRRYRDDMGTSSACQELGIFITTGIVISAFGLPIVLAHAPQTIAVIEWGACALILAGNIVVFLTILGFFLAFDNDDVDYSMW